jgi:hypothetical protein
MTMRSVRNVVLVGALALTACNKDKDAAPAVASKPASVQTAPAPKGDTPRVEAPEYVVELTARANGGSLQITAKPPLHVNAEYPIAFKPEPGGAKFAGDKVPLTADVKKPCADKAEDTCVASLPLPYEGGAGAVVAGTLLFSVCEPEKCLIEKVRLAATVP